MSDPTETGSNLLAKLQNTFVASLGVLCQEMTCEKIRAAGQLEEDAKIFDAGIKKVIEAIENSQPCYNRPHVCWY
jgi:hypothetical protein